MHEKFREILIKQSELICFTPSVRGSENWTHFQETLEPPLEHNIFGTLESLRENGMFPSLPLQCQAGSACGVKGEDVSVYGEQALEDKAKTTGINSLDFMALCSIVFVYG